MSKIEERCIKEIHIKYRGLIHTIKSGTLIRLNDGKKPVRCALTNVGFFA